MTSTECRRRLALVFVIGIAVRYAVGVFYTYPTDINYWMVVSENLASGESLYAVPGYYYTPIWGCILALVTPIIQFSGIPYGEYAPEFVGIGHMAQDWNCVMPSLEFALVMKTVLFIIDALVMLVIFKIGCILTDERKATVFASIWFLCPFVIIISSIRVMFENLEILLMLLALYAMLLQRPVESGILIALSLMVKPYGVFLAILMIGFSYSQRKDLGYTACYVLSAALMGVMVLLPALLQGHFGEAMAWVSNQSPGQSSQSSYNSVAVLVPFLLLISAIASACMAKYGSGDGRWLVGLALLFTASMLVVPGNIQYYLVLLPLAILLPIGNNKPVLIMFLILSFFAFISYNEWSAALYVHYEYFGYEAFDAFSKACSELSEVFMYNPLKTLTAVLAMLIPVFPIIDRRGVRFGS